jgi:hypothetical protein
MDTFFACNATEVTINRDVQQRYIMTPDPLRTEVYENPTVPQAVEESPLSCNQKLVTSPNPVTLLSQINPIHFPISPRIR